MKNIFYYIIFALCTPIIFSSCKDDKDDSLEISSEVDILNFSINGVEGDIDSNNSTISVIMPTGTDLKSLTPQIQIPEGASISPKSGEAVNFLDKDGNLKTVTYIVTYKDSYQKYTVSADVARAKITKFKIGSVEAEIDDYTKKILIYLPIGTDVKSLFPNVEYTEGAVITPAIGEGVDFTNPVIYSLEYFNSTFEYEVTVILGDKPTPALVIYNGEDVSPTWETIAASSINSKTVNIYKDAVNSSDYCASMTRVKEDTDAGGKPWSGGAIWNSNRVDIDPAKYTRFSVKVLKQTAGTVQLEIQSDGEGNKETIKVLYSAANLGKWQELIFEIPSGRTAHINSILIAPHCEDAKTFETQQIYWDDLKALPKQ